MPPTFYDLISLAIGAIHKRGAIALESGGMACLAHILAPSFFLTPPFTTSMGCSPWLACMIGVSMCLSANVIMYKPLSTNHSCMHRACLRATQVGSQALPSCLAHMLHPTLGMVCMYFAMPITCLCHHNVKSTHKRMGKGP